MRSTLVRLGLLALSLLLALALSSARRDVAPPEVYVEVAERVAAAAPFDLFLSANEPVTYQVRYGDLELERISQDLTVSLLALHGSNELEITAIDAGANSTVVQRSIVGVGAVVPVLSAPAEVAAGDPLTVTASWNGDATVTSSALRLDGARGLLRSEENSLRMIAAVPLGSTDAIWSLEAELVDEFGRVSGARADLRIAASRHPVQELNVAAETLSVITPAGRDLEREAFELAYSSKTPEPSWAEPFLMPIEGRSTSGFGLPRRYAPGGPVSYHEGSDIGAPTGTPIHAANAGVVRVADFFPIKGGLTIIDHGAGVSSLYFHQSRIAVSAGDEVERGQVIGEVGSTGLSTGPHLHWEMRVDETPTNPMAWVGKMWP